MHLSDYDDLVQLQKAEEPSPKELGARIARLRAEEGLTILSLAAKAGISRGLVSEMERGIGNPSYSTLVSIARALNVHVGTLFGGEPDQTHGVVRADHRRSLRLSDGPVYELLTPTIRGRLAMYLSHIPPGWSNEELPLRHAGEESAFVVSGEVLIHVGDESSRLGEGDAMTWDAAEPHWCRNETDSTVVLMYSMTPPNF